MSRTLGSLLALSFALLFLPSMRVHPADAAPMVGFIEEWPGTSLQFWGGGSNYSNPGTGGLLGAGDGYLVINSYTTPQGKLGGFSVGDEYLGDWIAAGIDEVQVYLNDVNADENLEIHFSIGQALSNVWQYNVGFIPPENQWAPFVVDLSSSANWTRTHGSGPFSAALQNVDRVLWRHDRAPYTLLPDSISADVGIDHMVTSNHLVGIEPRASGVGLPVELAAPAPNPSHGPVSLSFRTHDGGAVRFGIVDVAGRVVRRAVLPAAPAGSRIWLWDGRDDRGALSAPGAYRVRAVGPAGGTSRSIVRVR